MLSRPARGGGFTDDGKCNWGSESVSACSLGPRPTGGQVCSCARVEKTLSQMKIKTRSGFIQFVFLTLADWPSRFHAPNAVQTVRVFSVVCWLLFLVKTQTQRQKRSHVAVDGSVFYFYLLPLMHFCFSLFSKTKQLVRFFNAIVHQIWCIIFEEIQKMFSWGQWWAGPTSILHENACSLVWKSVSNKM